MTVSTSADIPLPIATIWAMISDFSGLKNWHPLVDRCETVGQGEGAVRTVHFADWWATESLDRLDHDHHVLEYRVIDSSRPAVIGVKGSMRLTSLSPDATRIDWVSGLQADHPAANEVNQGLQAYYPVRLGHLRAALGLPS
ncbi:SRPBCC family protein [Rhizorhabdus argentea]|uniref:SRPBCC family protein n=1 Tax=Rhizorhabdus argentea TaxID=1387174 RepID=UPI0030EF05CC